MTFDEMVERRQVLIEWLIELRHSIWDDPARGALIEYWIGREIGRYERLMNSSLLSPCPFCGVDSYLRIRAGSIGTWVSCGKCKADGPLAQTEMDARRAWNDRDGVLYWKVRRKV